MAIKTSYIVWSIIILGLGGMFLYAGMSGSDGVEGVQCSPMEYANFHIHPHLQVFVNGEEMPVPTDIGIYPNCLYWLHTHDSTGIVHVEAPTKRDFTLGQFLDIWNKTYVGTLSEVNVANAQLTANGEVYQGNYRDVIFEDKQVLVLQFGEPFVEPPEYVFPPNY